MPGISARRRAKSRVAASSGREQQELRLERLGAARAADLEPLAEPPELRGREEALGRRLGELRRALLADLDHAALGSVWSVRSTW